MPMRFVLPVAAVGLVVIASGQLAAQSSSPTQIRPAQVPQAGPCDALVQQVEDRMPTAVGFRLHDVQDDLSEAQELCNSGQPEQGTAILREILNYMNEGP
jgi:hypothetical protein